MVIWGILATSSKGVSFGQRDAAGPWICWKALEGFHLTLIGKSRSERQARSRETEKSSRELKVVSWKTGGPWRTATRRRVETYGSLHCLIGHGGEGLKCVFKKGEPSQIVGGQKWERIV